MKNPKPTDEPYILLDGRAALDPEEGAIMLSGTAKECCDAANSGEYGEGCVVADLSNYVLWEWFATGKWIPAKRS